MWINGQSKAWSLLIMSRLNFFHFHTVFNKILAKYVFPPKLRGWRRSSGKSLLHHLETCLVDEWVIYILLECFLVNTYFYRLSWELTNLIRRKEIQHYVHRQCRRKWRHRKWRNRKWKGSILWKWHHHHEGVNSDELFIVN